jgi:hypothetical protein
MRTPSTSRIAALSACLISACLAGATLLVPSGVAGAATPRLPQSHAAKSAASWLATQVTKAGDITSTTGPDLSDTAFVPLDLAATKTHGATIKAVVTYLEAHVNAYVKQGGTDGPGELATLILDAKAAGVNPRRFGRTDLVSRLLSTMHTKGVDKGLFGAQSATYDGAYRQGLSLEALAAAGLRRTKAIQPAISWLQHQQCSYGGWEAYRSLATACSPSDPSTYTGADSNSTTLAIEGLVAQHASIPHRPVSFFASIESTSGGWGYYGGSADPDSTSLVIQGLIALHQSVSAARWQKGAATPVSVLLSFQLKSGAFYYPYGPIAPNLLATEQAILALEGDALT